MQASRKDVGSAVGRMVFGGQTSKKGIARQLRAVDSEKLKTAFERHGLGDVSIEKAAEVLSGKNRAGWSTGKIKKTVQALQDVHVASAHQGASKMVLTATRNTQEKTVLSPEQKAKYFKQLARERRLEANQEEQISNEPMGVLDRMRGATGRANKTTSLGSKANVGKQGDIRGLRAEMREQMRLAPKMIIPPLTHDDVSDGF